MIDAAIQISLRTVHYGATKQQSRKFYLYPNPVDVQKSFIRLTLVELDHKDAFKTACFADRARNRIKLVFSDHTGCLVWPKSLEGEPFKASAKLCSEDVALTVFFDSIDYSMTSASNEIFPPDSISRASNTINTIRAVIAP
ncbi:MULTISPECIES: IS66 family insertion sequence element accessory protein TnpB [Pseudomonas]|uniref:IS66 family insertion sequence element accessory protein TnpB n=1 Tax=Pseudomonas TaxID=286 RepID=UPI003906D418